MVTHGNILADLQNFNYWRRYTEGGIYRHATPIFHMPLADAAQNQA
jgi:hypothetical protein